MPTPRRKWHHRLLGTVDQRRRVRDIALRHIGLCRSRVPLPLVGRDDLMLPNVVRGAAAEILLQRSQLTFVQVGVFDGRSDDDLTNLLDFPGVQGVLVEPQPEPFEQLRTRFGRLANVHLANVAIAPETGERELYRPRAGQSRLASLDAANLLRHGVAPQDIAVHRVRCLPLDQLLCQLEIERLDVLQIDAEGYDLEVLATLNFDRWLPEVVRFEYSQLPRRQLASRLNDLSRRGYRFLLQQRDIVACRSATPARST